MASEDVASENFVPTLPPDEVERIRAWHERAFAASRSRQEEVVDYLGLSLIVPPTVQPITPTPHLLGEAVLDDAREGEQGLDMGTGCGVNAILAATKGSRVIAVDINPEAVGVARTNAERSGVTDLVEVGTSDVFSEVPESFDLIVFDPPFRWFKPRDLAEAAITDENYRAMTQFFSETRTHLVPDGRMLIFFGTSGDIDYLKELMNERGFSYSEAARLDGEKDGVAVSYSTFKVT
ncbi:MAG: methyltransferase [Acidimicrobiales bacterium]